MLGRIVSHYRVVERLGSGGMGVVYKALDLRLERTVALKFLNSEVAVSAKDRAQLLQEARSASALDHPNIGIIHGIEETGDGHVFIVMAHYDGETLAQRLLRCGSLPLPEALDFAVQIASGLSAAHARNVVHRDVKPSNILITTGDVAKIVDFGLARIIASASATQSHVSGSLPYMAPEQILAEPVGPSCDVWALGIVTVQMVAGIHPFARENANAMTFAILNQPPEGIDKTHVALRPLLYRALSKDPAYRGASADEMLTALEGARNNLAAAQAQTSAKQLIPIPRRPTSELRQSIERASTPRWATTSKQRPLVAWITLAALGLLAIVFALLPWVRQRIAAPWTRGPIHIAVLPFDNVGNHPENDVVVQGLMDSLAGKLANFDAGKRPLWVVPASEIRRRKITDPTAALKQLRATLVVKGSVARDGQDVHLNVNLIDTKNLRQIGSADLEDPAGDLATLQNEAVSRIAIFLNLSLPPGNPRNPTGATNAAAYEDYLKAVGYMERHDKPGRLDLAIAALKNSVHTDPRFALGYAQLGEAYRLKYQLDHNETWLQQAQANCQKAVELDNRMPAVYVTLGYLHEAAAKHDLALHEFQRALDLDPTNAAALSGLASAYEHSGRIADAEAAFQKAIALRPDDWDGYNGLGNFYDRHGKYDDAVTAFRKAIDLTPDNTQAYLNLGAVYLDIGDAKSLPLAEQALKKSIELSPSYQAYANLGNLYSLQQRYAESAAATEKALQLNDRDYLVWDNLVAAYEWLKNPGKADAARQRMLPLVEQAVVLRPQDAVAQSMLAKIYAKDQAEDKALGRAKTALALAPDDPNVLSNISEAYELMHDRRHALEYLGKALHNGLAMSQVRADPDLHELLKDPHFHAANP